MKTSVMEVHDMLSVWSVDEVEKRIGEVPGVESAAESATVRYDETRLEVPDIKSAVRQRGYESAAPAASSGDGHKGQTAPGEPPANPAPAAPKTPPAAGAAQKQDKAVPDAPPSTTPKASPAEPNAAPALTSVAPKSAPDAAPAGHDQHTKDKS